MSKDIKMERILGLDIGIASCGWAVMNRTKDDFFDEKGLNNLDSFGVHLWKIPEEPKSNKSNAEMRREKRAARRRFARRTTRIRDIKKFLSRQEFNFITEQEINLYFGQLKKNLETNKTEWIPGTTQIKKDQQIDPLDVKYRGLKGEKLTSLEIVVGLIHYTKHRGYNNFFDTGLDEKKESKKEVSDWEKSKENAQDLISKYNYPTIAIQEQLDGQFRNKDNKYLINKNKELEKNEAKLTKEQIAKELESLKDLKSKKRNILFTRKNYKQEVRAFLINQAKYFPFLEKNIDDLVNNYIFRQRFFEDGPGPRDEKTREKWVKTLRDTSPESIRKKFFELVSNCSIYPNELRLSKISIFADLYIILQNFASDFGANYKLNNGMKFEEVNKEVTNFILNFYLFELYKISFDEKKQTPLRSDDALKTRFRDAIQKFMKDKKIDFVYNVKNDQNLSFNLIKLYTLAPSLVETELSNLKNYKDIKELFKNLSNSKIERACKILTKTITPEKRYLELEKLRYVKSFIETNKNFVKNENKEKTEKELFIEEIKKIRFSTGTLNVSKKWCQNAFINQINTGQHLGAYMDEVRKNEDQKLNDRIQKKLENDNDTLIKFKNKVNEFGLFEQTDFNQFVNNMFKQLNDKDMRRNSVVFRAVNEVRKVLKALHKKYQYFDVITVEVATELYNAPSERKNIQNRYEDNRKNNLKVIEEIKKISTSIPINSVNIDRYKLWKQQVEKDLYDPNFAKIDPKDMFTNKYEIDHIVPYAAHNDNTINNKVLTLRKYNQEKGKQTPLQYFNSINHTQTQIKKYEIEINTMYSKRNKKRDTTRLKEHLLAKGDDISQFTSANLNDTRYITKVIIDYLNKEIKTRYCKELSSLLNEEINTTILPLKGRVTSNLRRQWLGGKIGDQKTIWGSEKPRDITPFHHAVDAIILANISKEEQAAFYTEFTKLNVVRREMKKILEDSLTSDNLEKAKTYFEIASKEFRERWNNINRIYNNKDSKDNKNFYYKKDYAKWNNFKNKLLKELASDENIFRADIKLFKEKRSFEYDYLPTQNLQQLVIDRIPVKLKLVKNEDLKKEERDINPINAYNLELDYIETKEDYDQMFKDETNVYYPIIHYRIDYKLPKLLVSAENATKKLKNNINEKGKEVQLIKDKFGNNWETNIYYGIKICDKPYAIKNVEVHKLIKTEGIKKIVVPNTIFISKDLKPNLYKKETNFLFARFTGKSGGNMSLSSNPLLVYSGNKKYNKQYKEWPYFALSKFKDSRILKIDILGKME